MLSARNVIVEGENFSYQILPNSKVLCDVSYQIIRLLRTELEKVIPFVLNIFIVIIPVSLLCVCSC